MEDDNKVTLNLEEFLEMRDDAIAYNELLNIIFSDCSISWDDSLNFNDKNICGYLNYATHKRYKRKIDELKAEKENDR